MDLKPWQEYIATLDYRPLFVTVSGAHIYGFPSPDSDVDLRGCHLLPLKEVVGLSLPEETIDRSSVQNGTEVDIVSHEIGKYLRLLVKNNGYVMEQIFSPLVVLGQDFLDELRPIAQRCITRFHAHHYLGFYSKQRKLLEKEPVKKAKSLLYAYRVLLTGLNLMNTGKVETNILTLNDDVGLPFIEDLIAMKTQEKIELKYLDWNRHSECLDDLQRQLESAFESSKLPERRDKKSVNNFLLKLRLG